MTLDFLGLITVFAGFFAEFGIDCWEVIERKTSRATLSSLSEPKDCAKDGTGQCPGAGPSALFDLPVKNPNLPVLQIQFSKEKPLWPEDARLEFKWYYSASMFAKGNMNVEASLHLVWELQ